LKARKGDYVFTGTNAEEAELHRDPTVVVTDALPAVGVRTASALQWAHILECHDRTVCVHLGDPFAKPVTTNVFTGDEVIVVLTRSNNRCGGSAGRGHR